MASSLAPIIQAFKADAAIAKGVAVKAGASSDAYVQKCTAKTDKSFGVAQSAATAADDKIEVAVDGGGKGLLGGTVAMGDKLAPTTDGSLIATTTEDDTIVAIADAAGVIGDLIPIRIMISGGGA